LAVRRYALGWVFINDMVKFEVYRLLHLGNSRHQRHLARVNVSLHLAAVAKAGTLS